MAEYHFPGHKYTEDDCFFKTIDMSKPEDEFDMFGTSPTSCIDFPADCIDTSALFNFRVVKRRHRHNYCTLAHGADAPPPAPPSTPTSLTAIANPTSVTAIAIPTSLTANGATPMSSPTATSSTNSIVASTTATATAAAAADVDESLNNLFYILDYAPKYKMKVNKEQQRTDAELASLLNVITLSNNASTSSSSSSGAGGGGGGGGGLGSGGTPLEHRICSASRTIRKPSTSMKIFKIHRNPKWFFRKPDHEEDSVSAPEYDDSEEREVSIFSYRRQCIRRRAERLALRERRLEHSQQQQRMESLMHDFGNAMTFNEV